MEIFKRFALNFNQFYRYCGLKNKITCNAGSISQTNVSQYCSSTPSSQKVDNESKNILDVINSSSHEELSRFKLSRVRSDNLILHRSKNGLFKSLNEVLHTEGMDEKSLKKLCQNILKANDADITEKPIKVRGQLVTPSLLNAEKISSVVGIHIGANVVSWAKLERENTILSNWDFFDMTEITSKKIGLTDILHKVFDLAKQIPNADAYVFETSMSLSPSSQQQITSILAYQKNMQLTCMLITLLSVNPCHQVNNTDDSSQSEEGVIKHKQNVYFLRHRLPARLFKMLVGSERVAASNVVVNILNGINSKHHSLIGISSSFKRNYETAQAVEKENLGQALLLALAFMDLCIYKTPESLKAVMVNKK